MIVVGINGGIASGKTFVARELQRLGAVVLDADRTGHAVLGMPEVMRALRQRWGAAVFDSEGCVDRAAVARRVFAPPPKGPQELAFLEQLTHPPIRDRLAQELDALVRRPDVLMVVLDAAILWKAGWDRFCEQIIFVDAPDAVRLARVLERGWTPDYLANREAAQTPLSVKRERADVVIDASGSREETRAQVERFWHARGDFAEK